LKSLFNKSDFILVTHFNNFSISIQANASGNNQTLVNAENLHHIVFGILNTSNQSSKHCFLKSESSQATTTKCFL
jgi:hypothetical protein